MSLKLPIWDKRMIEFMQHCVETELCENEKDFLNSIGMHQSNLAYVKEKRRSFRLHHIETAAKKYKLNPNWLFGIDKTMLRK